MSYTMETEDGDGDQVATNRGWYDFCDWVATLDPGANPDLAGLAEQGYCDDLAGLAKQLRAALKGSPPSAEGVDVVAKGILAFLKRKKDARSLTITN